MDYNGKPISNAIPILLLILVIGLITLALSIKTVPTGYKGVLLTWGAASQVELDAGLHFVIPLAQDVTLVNVQIQKSELAVDAATKDLQSVQTKVAVNYHINAGFAAEVYSTIKGNVEDTLIEPAVEESVKSATAQFSSEDLIQERTKVKTVIIETLRERLSRNNLEVDEFSIVNFDFSQAFNQAIENKQLAEQDALKSQRELEKVKIEAEKRVVDAEANAKQLMLTADANAYSVRTQAQADSDAILLRAQAEAEGLSLKKQQLSSDLISMTMAERWDGVVPIQYNLGGGTNTWMKLPDPTIT